MDDDYFWREAIRYLDLSHVHQDDQATRDVLRGIGYVLIAIAERLDRVMDADNRCLDVNVLRK